MVFQEKKTQDGYQYKVEDVFGTMTIDSTQQLGPDLLDDIVVTLLRQNISAGTLTGKVKHAKGSVKYIFNRKPVWSDDDTPTSTSETASGSTATRGFAASILNWLRRFAEAFRAAWRSGKNNR